MPLHQTFDDSPLELPFDSKKKFFIELDIQKCITNLLGFPLLDSPFVTTLRAYAQGECHTYKGSPLEKFYSSCKPKTMMDVLSLNNSTMQRIPAIATVMPWWNLTPKMRLQQIATNPHGDLLLGRETVRFGLKKEGNYGWQYFGPVSQEVGEIEFKRLTAVYDSIDTHGYRWKKSIPIHGEFLISNDDWLWVGLGGKHRMSALVALGWEFLPATARGKYGLHFVKRSEVNYWPNVVSGLFSENEALTVFDTMMSKESFVP